MELILNTDYIHKAVKMDNENQKTSFYTNNNLFSYFCMQKYPHNILIYLNNGEQTEQCYQVEVNSHTIGLLQANLSTQ